MHGILLLSHAIFLSKKIHFAPQAESIWAYLLDMKIASKKESKKVHFLFMIVDILHESDKTETINLTQIAQRLSAYKKSLSLTESKKKTSLVEITEDSLLERCFLELEYYENNYGFNSHQRDFYLSLLTTIFFKKNKILSDSPVQMKFSPEMKETHLYIAGLEEALTAEVQKIEQIEKTFESIQTLVNNFGRVELSAKKAFSALIKKPILSCKSVQKTLSIAKPNAQLFLEKCVSLRILELVTKNERNRIYGNKELLSLLGLENVK